MFTGEMRPVLVYIVGIATDYLIARGWLMPDQRQVWVQGWVDIISSAGSVVLSMIFLYHEGRLLLAKTKFNATSKTDVSVKTDVQPTQQISQTTTTEQTGLPISQ